MVVVVVAIVLHFLAQPRAVRGPAAVVPPGVGSARGAGADRVVVGVVLAVTLHPVAGDCVTRRGGVHADAVAAVLVAAVLQELVVVRVLQEDAVLAVLADVVADDLVVGRHVQVDPGQQVVEDVVAGDLTAVDADRDDAVLVLEDLGVADHDVARVGEEDAGHLGTRAGEDVAGDRVLADDGVGAGADLDAVLRDHGGRPDAADDVLSDVGKGAGLPDHDAALLVVLDD